MTTPVPRSLYVHVPFCHTICGYCDFYSEVFERDRAGPLVDALLAETLRRAAPFGAGFETCFVGGGTPTTLPPDDLHRLLSSLARHLDPRAQPEFTVEANPATVTPEVAAVLAACGVNRISIGAQSFDPSELRVLERIHRVPQVAETVENARRAGIDNVNLDLIFGVPGQTLGHWVASLRQAIRLRPSHLSCYGLTYERGTPLFAQREAGRVRPVSTETEAEMYEATIDLLATAGFEHYEISNFARPGARCRHNLTYWNNLPHVAIGPSAAGLLDEQRYRNVPDTAEYVRAVAAGRDPASERERLDAGARTRETAVLGLRLVDGLERAAFRERFGSDPCDLFADAIARHTADGLMVADEQAVRLTRRGLLVADAILVDFV